MRLTFTGKPARASMMAVLMLSGILSFSPSWAQSVEEIYGRAVQQLNREGFAGIDRALAVFEELIQRDPDFVRGYVSAADAYLLKYEFTERKDRQWLVRAMSYLDTAVGKERNNPAIHFKRAVIYFNLEQPDRAVEDLRKSMDLAPQYLDARLLYLQHLLSLKKQEDARQFVDDSIALFPGDPAPLGFLELDYAAPDNSIEALILKMVTDRFGPASAGEGDDARLWNLGSVVVATRYEPTRGQLSLMYMVPRVYHLTRQR